MSNAAFDQSAGSAQTAYITEKWREKHKFSWDYHLRVAASGETESLTFQIGAGSYNRVSEGDNVTVTEHPSIPLKKQQESRKSLALLGEMAYNSLACDSHRAE